MNCLPAWVIVLAVGSLAAVATPAIAHVQVRPTLAAPKDPVLFEVLVPNESRQATTRVELAVPRDVIPFSFEETPGWTRRTTNNPDQSLRSIVWRGRLAPSGFARFTFLASTPPKPGTVVWKSIQTYEDGRKVRWIGPPDSEEPAAVTTVSAEAPRENAGGEGGERAPSPPADQRRQAASSVAASEGDQGSDGLARGLAAGGLAVGLAALGVAAAGRQRRRG